MILLQLFDKYIQSLRILVVLFTLFQQIFSQNLISFDFKDTPLKTALLKLSNEYKIPIIFAETIPNPIINSNCNKCSETEAITSILSSTYLTWDKNKNQFVIISPIIENNFSVKGQVVDHQSGVPIPYANVYINKLHIGDISAQDGTFFISNISLPNCSLVVSYIGYETKRIKLSFLKNLSSFQKISLYPKIINSNEISITGMNREFMDESDFPGQISFSPRHISTLPNLGEVDIFRSLQFLPGIQLGLGETSNLYIRGGLPGQNLIILDGMPIYKTSHMFGFISGISSEAIKDIQIYKGNIPAKYGGRISSVIDISSRIGNVINPHASIYTNLMSQGITTELPLLKNGSWILNFRKSNPAKDYSQIYSSIQDYLTGDDKFNLLTESANSDNNQNTTYSINSSYQDLISRFSFLLSPIHRISLTHITGLDTVVEDREYFGFNAILGSDTNYIKEKTKLFHNGTVINFYSNWSDNYSSHLNTSNYRYSSHYNSKQDISSYSDSLYSSSNANDNVFFSEKSIKFIQEYKSIKNHKIISGIEENYYDLKIQNIKTDGSTSNDLLLSQTGYIHSFYLHDQWRENATWMTHSSIRISYFSNNEVFYFEPRFALSYRIFPSTNIEASFGKHHQFIQHLSNEDNNMNQNIGVISSHKIPVTSSLNTHAGFNYEIIDYNFSFNIYTRSLEKLLYSENPIIMMLENNLINIGDSFSRGAEILFRKKTGLFTGWLSYHFNQTKFNFPSLNNGKSFSPDYGRMHELKTVLITSLFNTHITATWVLSSGGRYTNIRELSIGSGYDIMIAGNKNNETLGLSHHLDVSINKNIRLTKFQIDTGFSVYNLYNNKNISHKRYNPYTSEISMKDIAMFGITPSFFIKINF